MKKSLLLLFVSVFMVGTLFAQQDKDTISYPNGRYLYSPIDTTTNIGFFNNSYPIAAPGFDGHLQYEVMQPRIIYGIAVTPKTHGPVFWRPDGDQSIVDSSTLDTWAVLVQKEGSQFVHVDSVIWHQREPDRYFRYWSNNGDNLDTVVPVYEFYFNTPHEVHDSFYVGFRSDYVMTPEYEHITPFHFPPQWVWHLQRMSGSSVSSTWYNEGWRVMFIGGEPLFRWWQVWGGIFPIIARPDTDAVVGMPVMGFHRTEDYDGCPAFVWDRTAGQLAYEFGYGPADQDPDDYMIVTTTMAAMILRDSTLDSTVVYAARCRASSHHACAIHDTTVWSEWTDTVQFRLSTATPHGGEGIVPVEWGEVAFALSPNPAKERVTVAVGEDVVMPCTVVLRDEQGRELLRQRMEGRELTLSTRGLATGVCLVTVESPRGSSTQKLVVEN